MGAAYIASAASLAAGSGMYLLYTGAALGWTGLGLGPRKASRRNLISQRLHASTVGSLFEHCSPWELASKSTLAAAMGAFLGYLLFQSVVMAGAFATVAACVPTSSIKSGQRRRQELARAAWPRLLEEIRIATGSLGSSIPQAVFDAGRRGHPALAGAFAQAEREWLVSTDFERTVDILKAALSDPAADAILETLLVAHEVGGSQLDDRLRALIEDRIADVEARKDALAKQSGVRFARRFVLTVPLGMAVAGLSIGTGAAAYATPGGEIAALVAVGTTALCWIWAGRLMRLPEPQRVFGPLGVQEQ